MLSAWATSAYRHPKLKAILAYVRGGRVVQNLIDKGTLPTDSDGRLQTTWTGPKAEMPAIFRVLKNPDASFVRWRVEAPGDPASGTWEDATLVRSWVQYYGNLQTKRGLDMANGDLNAVLAEQHPSKIRNDGDKAKLISSNDRAGYTFRGRLTNSDQACGVSFQVTQRAHSALSWLIRRQGHSHGDQVIVTWAVSGKPLPDPFQNSLDLFLNADELGVATANHEVRPSTVSVGDVGQAFALRLNKAISGYQAKLDTADNIVVLALDSASKGRLAITFYRELAGSEFLKRVQRWHESFAWHQDYGANPVTRRPLRFVGAPSPKDISEAAYGHLKEKTRKLAKSVIERLLPCIVDSRAVPRDLVESVVRRTCNRAAFEKGKKGQERLWEKNLGIACALFRGFFTERAYQMSLEPDRLSRDYLYGRLLAIADRIERVALNVASEKRETNAARLMQRFSDRPFSTWRSIELALTPYRARLRVSRPSFLAKADRLLDAVICSFSKDDFQSDQRLSGEFLLGYHCQRAALRPPQESEPADLLIADSDGKEN